MALTDKWTDQRVEEIIGNLLRAGVLLAGAVVLAGGVLYLHSYGHREAAYKIFYGEPENLRSLHAIVRGAFHGNSRAIIQFGLVLLIATPVARVIFAAAAFAMERDRRYVVVSLIVLATLMYSLLGDHG